MTVLRTARFLLLLLGAFALSSAYAQQAENETAPTAPELKSLEGDWWSYFAGTRDEIAPRAEAFAENLALRIADLDAANESAALSALDAIQDNLSAYLALLDEDEVELIELPPPALSYSIDNLLKLAANARKARAEAAAERLEVEREQRILDGATRRRDLAFKDYVDASGDDARILAALRLIQTRSAQAIATRRSERLQQRYERSAARADELSRRVELASTLLAPSEAEADLAQLTEAEEAAEQAVVRARERLREAELAAIGLDLDTPEGRSQARLQQQKRLQAEVQLALAQVALAGRQARRWWTESQQDAAPNMGALQDDALAWSELIRTVDDAIPEWRRISEDELLSVQTAARDGMNRASRRLLDQRLGLAQGTLNDIGELQTAVADLTLLGGAVDSAIAEYSGALQSWLTSARRQAKATYLRLVGLSDATLFSIGETPVTGGDILRVIIIFAIAFVLSRGIRHAIRRFSTTDSSGTQASLYTVGRLTHYTIIIIASFIALSSIGLDFSNLALVAGALSVGIGFGLQSIVSNFVSGLIILFEHTLRVGDYIELDTGLTGTVKAINVRSTLINTNDNIDIVVPNSEFVTARLTNWTLGERILRVRIPFGVAYGSDKELVRKAALEATAEVPYTLTHMKGREPDVWLVEFGDSSLNFLLLVWVNRQGAKRPTRTRASYLWALETKLNEYGIEIPFPQRDLRLRSGWSPPKPEDMTFDNEEVREEDAP
ncbi:MAG: mechanosensitive ion channel [Gammaproteobacteria bacterium]|jgi:small-conductance mechanosensitive channel|nr:mechanosensitive ion channel [Gammaproteobacteria bacterium]MDH3982978.1 mechanosensitive ion channel [Gammaproteobacteria bacterium]